MGAATYGLLGTSQAQIVDIRQEAPWGSVIWRLIAEIPCWFAPERGHCRTRVGGYLAAGSLQTSRPRQPNKRIRRAPRTRPEGLRSAPRAHRRVHHGHAPSDPHAAARALRTLPPLRPPSFTGPIESHSSAPMPIPPTGDPRTGQSEGALECLKEGIICYLRKEEKP